YLFRAYLIFTVLELYFTPTETNKFRIIQAFTGLLISGSAAFQLFIHRSRCDLCFNTSDLDLYVEHRYSLIVGKFLVWCRYEFVARPDQSQNFAMAVTEVEGKICGYADRNYSNGRGFAGVYNFVKGGMKIQLITARNSVLDIVLNFHSTIVMNVISHSHAYLLYPRALQDKVSLICCSNEGPERDDARQKYIDCGYCMVNGDGTPWRSRAVSPPTSSPEPEFDDNELKKYFYVFQERHLNDSATWRIPLSAIDPEKDAPWIYESFFPNPAIPSFLRYENLMRSPLIEVNSWALALEESELGLNAPLGGLRCHRHYMSQHIIYQKPSLYYVYCLSKTVMDNVGVL
ncbi:hypothetical protein BDP27DRAFT_1218029, partial [Rhodocollybia butyracea]